MIFKVYSKKLIEQGIVRDLQDCYPDKKIAVISITDSGGMFSLGWKRELVPARVVHREKNFYNVCRLYFDDTDGTETGYDCITERDANRIIDFLLAAQKDGVEIMVVHCHAGRSRSAAVAAACSIILGQSDAEFFVGRFTPNMKVYRMVLNAYQERC